MDNGFKILSLNMVQWMGISPFSVIFDFILLFPGPGVCVAQVKRANCPHSVFLFSSALRIGWCCPHGEDLLYSVYRLKYWSLPKTPSQIRPETLFYQLSGHLSAQPSWHKTSPHSPPWRGGSGEREPHSRAGKANISFFSLVPSPANSVSAARHQGFSVRDKILKAMPALSERFLSIFKHVRNNPPAVCRRDPC